MNTCFPGFSQACVHGFRARGLFPRPGKTSFLNFLTTAFAGMTLIGADLLRIPDLLWIGL
jgi:hypothetical protein